MGGAEDEEGSVLGPLESFVWDSEENAAYEAALEAINAAVGAYSARIAAEQRQPVPDDAAIAALRDGQTACARARERLRPTYREQVAETRRHYSALARSLAGR